MTGVVVTVLSVVAYAVALWALVRRLPPPSPWRDDTVAALGCMIAAAPAALAVQAAAYLLGFRP